MRHPSPPTKFFNHGGHGRTRRKSKGILVSPVLFFPVSPVSPVVKIASNLTTDDIEDHRQAEPRLILLESRRNRMASPAIIPTPRINQVSGIIVNAAMRVHSLVGPGLLEIAYQACLAQELRKRGLLVESQLGLPVIYEGERLDLGYRIDLLVESLVIVEIKCVEAIHPVHEAQLLSYLRLSGKNVGLLINFHVPRLKDGIKRMVDGRGWEK
jgi:GxxExxY protein